ncbi:MAG TPA: type VI secretion system tip protein TssI/VgrG [Acetobacteraceae bacterium]
MDAYSQDQRLLQIDTVLGKDHVILVSLQGEDRISALFAYDIEIASTDPAIRPDDILGTAATLLIHDRTGAHATINGIVSRFGVGARDGRGLVRYRMRLVPALWFLTRTSDCRIFQDMNVRAIVDAVLADHGIQRRDWKLSAEHEERPYCVQYGETAYSFISRLLEEEGIFFHFRHDQQGHTVVFSDHNHALPQCPEGKVPLVSGSGELGGIWRWEKTYRFRSAQWALADFNFETPSTDLTTQKKTINQVLARRPYEMFTYPGRYAKKAPGESLTKLRIEYEEGAYQEITGESGCAGFAAGSWFALADAGGQDNDKEFLLTAVQHSAQDLSLVSQDADPPSYANSFTCALRSLPYRPRMATPRPRIHGTQTAIVTGPAGSEICTDKYGRIKVQFHWDRYGKKNDHSSCWIRVAQGWAGRGWGGWFVPRIGQEVVVSFLDGDPDRPLVVGSVYNAEQTVPFGLPANATQSGLRTRSSMGGSGATCNELRFEDRKGSEQVYLHAERNLDASVEADETHSVGHDQTITVDHDRKKTVVNNEMTMIGANRTETVGQNESVTISLARTHTIGTVDTLTVGAARVHTVGAAEAISVGAARTISVGAMQSVQVGASQSIEVGSDQKVSVGGNDSLSIGKGRSVSIGQDDQLNVGKKLTISAGDEIVLKTGSATITMKKSGDITIEGSKITVKGSGDVIFKGQKILQN